MKRPANIAVSQWFRGDSQCSSSWKAKALCSQHLDLPWIGEKQPESVEYGQMAQICADCPVMRDCARYALGTDVNGGFYAGVWLPWAYRHEPHEMRHLRRRSRDTLHARTRVNNIDVIPIDRTADARHPGRSKPATF